MRMGILPGKQAVYRYSLTRGPWLNGEGTVLFVMLNPSTADAHRDDPTIRRCVAQSWGFARLNVGNPYALRATDPRELFAAADPVGPRNDLALGQLAESATQVIVAWGSTPHPQPRRAVRVRTALERVCGTTYCLGHTTDLHPRHPLYVRRGARRVPFGHPAGVAA